MSDDDDDPFSQMLKEKKGDDKPGSRTAAYERGS